MEENKKLKKTQLNCKSCGGVLIYSPKERKLKCAFCNSTQEIEFDPNFVKHDYTENAENTDAYNEFAQNNKVFKCSSCGADIILSKLDISKRCPYCGGACVIKNEEIKGLSPDAIIPFKYSKEESVALYIKGVKKKWFLPKKIKKAPPVDEIKGVYIPCFSFDADTTTQYHGVLEEDHTTGTGENRKTVTTRQYISGTKRMKHVDIMVETSSHLNQKLFSKIKPYNTNELVKFKSEFITGYSVEYYDESLNSCKNTADSIMEDIIKSAILSGYSYDRVASYSQTTAYANQKFAYYILPTYQINFMYKQKNRTIFMNGQTGKVGGGLPRSPIKITFFVLFILALLFGLGILIFAFG